MSYPNVIYGDFGDEKVAQSTKIGNLPLGQLMILPDGRKFRHAQIGAASIRAGQVVSSEAGLAGDGCIASSGLKASATVTHNAVGDTNVYVATSLTAFTKDQFAEGTVNVIGPAASTYIGQVYKIKGNDAAASVGVGGAAKITLYETDPLKVAWAPTSTLVSVRKSAFKSVVANAGSGPIAPPVGVIPTAASINFYCWAQRGGEASCLQAATVCVDGKGVIASSVEAGSVTVALSAAAAASISDLNHILGYAMEGQAASTAVRVFLTLE